MRMSLGKNEIQLEDRKALAFRGANNFDLDCTRGSAWITIEGNLSDFVLTRGERMHIESDGLGLIQGMPSCCVYFTRMATNEMPQEARSPMVTFGDMHLSEPRTGLVMFMVEISNRLLKVFKQNPESINPETSY